MAVSPPEIAKWSKPSPGRYKCNVDAFFFKSLNKVGIGICIRDEGGAFVLARIERLTPNCFEVGQGSPTVEHGF